jgi:lipoprotein-anchoring transpeptidase ErfK/SrfK
MKRIACPIQTILALTGLLLAAPPAGAQSLFTLGETAYLDFAGTIPGANYYAPGDDESYLHVSIGSRRLRVMRGSEVLHEFPVAVGKGAYLRHRDTDSGGWLFETPVGVFSVGRKEIDPVWYAPDWHYVEKGRVVPAPDSPKRYFPGEMGKYALYLGDGLAIHGTRNQSSVGRAVSHGCMRLSKNGIATVYPLVKVGSRVIITQ